MPEPIFALGRELDLGPGRRLGPALGSLLALSLGLGRMLELGLAMGLGLTIDLGLVLGLGLDKHGVTFSHKLESGHGLEVEVFF